MTNLEKITDYISKEKVINQIMSLLAYEIATCDECPAKKFCEKNGKGCSENMKEWLEQESEEE